MSFKSPLRDSITYPGEIRKVGTGFFLPIAKKHMEMLGITEENMDAFQFDISIEVIGRPIEEEDKPTTDEDD
ncbi:MAG: hypothetical protein E7Z65_06505 [Thermoplasmata archaeon]|nr:hypothetical protein [Thermoplasmata archaeon]